MIADWARSAAMCACCENPDFETRMPSVSSGSVVSYLSLLLELCHSENSPRPDNTPSSSLTTAGPRLTCAALHCTQTVAACIFLRFGSPFTVSAGGCTISALVLGGGGGGGIGPTAASAGFSTSSIASACGSDARAARSSAFCFARHGIFFGGGLGTHHSPLRSTPPSPLPPTRRRSMCSSVFRSVSVYSSKAVPTATVEGRTRDALGRVVDGPACIAEETKVRTAEGIDGRGGMAVFS